MQKIVPHLWFDKEAKEAAEFYASLLPNSRVTNTTVIPGTPSGDCDVVSFQVWGYEFMAINAGPLFKINPSINFTLNFDPAQDKDAAKRIDEVWNKLTEGGTVLMPLQEYPFSKRYGWVEDKYGVSWQLILTDPAGEVEPLVIPGFMFVGEKCGKAEEAIQFYVSVFRNAHVGNIFRYGANQEPDKEGTVAHAVFTLEGQRFIAMDSAREHNFNFNEAVSLIVKCDTQEEIDYYWEKLSAVPEAEQCGWLKDKYGVSWQIVPAIMDEMMTTKDEAALARVTQAFLKMKKFDIATLEKAYNG
jgi:predicted 3-demethylubiquinone-9 3-methyltransferase (glyoxalase superfamily)